MMGLCCFLLYERRERSNGAWHRYQECRRLNQRQHLCQKQEAAHQKEAGSEPAQTDKQDPAVIFGLTFKKEPIIFQHSHPLLVIVLLFLLHQFEQPVSRCGKDPAGRDRVLCRPPSGTERRRPMMSDGASAQPAYWFGVSTVGLEFSSMSG